MTADALSSAEAANVTADAFSAEEAPRITAEAFPAAEAAHITADAGSATSAAPRITMPAVVAPLPTLSIPAPAAASPVSAPPAPISAPPAPISAPAGPGSDGVHDDGAMPEPTAPDEPAREHRAEATAAAGLRPEAAAEEPEVVDEPAVDGEPATAPPSLGLGLLAPLALIWLAATMWSAHASIAVRGSANEVIASTAALALPAVIASSLLAGAATGLAALSRWARDGGVLRRVGLAVGAGAALGLAAVAIILTAYGTPPAVMILASTVGGAALLGGALALIRPTVALAAGIAATMAEFVVATLLSYFQSPLKPIFGGGDTIESRVAAADRFSLATAIVGGVTAGLVAFAYLRRARGTRWPTYMLAGALPGLLALVAEGLTRVGGGPLLRAVAGLSVDNRWINEYLDDARINSILTIGFVGAIVATVAVGMTMRRPADDPETEDPEAPDPGDLG